MIRLMSTYRQILRSRFRSVLSLKGRSVPLLKFQVTHFSVMNSSTKPRVYVTRRIPHQALDMLHERCDVLQWDSDDAVPRSEILKNVSGVDALFCLLTDKIDAEVLDNAGKKLKVIGTMSVGHDHIDVSECFKRNISVGFTPDVLTDATAELTVALLLATSRRIPEGIKAVKTGEWGTWKPMWLCGQGLNHSTVGIVGLGRIGLAVSKRLQPFGVQRFLYTGRSERSEAKDIGAEYVSLQELARQSDFVIACCALSNETMGMFDMSFFSAMKKNAIFINTSRGGVVNQGDLYKALSDRMISAAGLDVTTPEPLPIDDPLLQLHNCIVLPHIGSAEEDTRSTMATLTAQNILAALGGNPMPAQVK